MAINYYANIGMIGSDIEMNQNELQLPVIDNEGTAPSTPVEGQMYFDTTAGDKVMYFWNGTAWTSMDASAATGVTTFTNANGTFIDAATVNTNATGAVTTGVIDLSATGTPGTTTFLRGDNVWATPSGSYTSWSLEGDTGTPVDITDGLRVDFTGGDGISTAVSTATPNKLLISNTGVTSIVAGTNVTISGATGAVTISSTDNNDNYFVTAASFNTTNGVLTISGNNAAVGATVDLDGRYVTSSGVTSVNFTTDGTALNVVSNTITGSGTMTGVWQGGSSQYVNGAGDLVTFPAIPQGDLTGLTEGTYIDITNATGPVPTINASGTEASTPLKLVARDSSGFGYVDTPSSGDSSEKIATTAFVQASLTGLLEFKGGFNASTGAIVGGGNLTSGGSRVAVAVGDYYVVTVAGDFFGNAATPLTPGDSVIVQTAAVAGASVEGDFIVVQSDTDLATNSTVGLMFINPTGSGITSNISSGQATLTNSDKGSSQNIFKNVASSSGTAVADNNNDTLTIVGAGSASTAVAGDTLTITATDTNTQYTAGIGLTLSGTEFIANVDGTQTVAANTSSTTASRTYKVQVDSSDDLVVNVPWANTNSGGTISSINATTDGNSLETSNTLTGNGTLTLAWQGNTASYVRGDGSLATFPTIPQGDVTGVTASTANDELGIIVGSSSGPVPVVGLDIKGLTDIGTGVASTDRIAVYDTTADKNFYVQPTNLAPAIRKASTYAEEITSFTSITHGLGSYDVIVQLYDATSYETIYAGVDRTGINTVAISGNTFPSGDIKVLVSLADMGA